MELKRKEFLLWCGGRVDGKQRYSKRISGPRKKTLGELHRRPWHGTSNRGWPSSWTNTWRRPFKVLLCRLGGQWTKTWWSNPAFNWRWAMCLALDGSFSKSTAGTTPLRSRSTSSTSRSIHPGTILKISSFATRSLDDLSLLRGCSYIT